MQAYKAYYEDGRVIPFGNPVIPEGSELIITVLEPPPKSRAKQQREAFKRFINGMDNTPPLPPEFDEIINQRVNINREINL
jgi:hypothetical protein